MLATTAGRWVIGIIVALAIVPNGLFGRAELKKV